MKANEAPEKIYLQPSEIKRLPYQNIFCVRPLADNSIEYTRTDAFMKKAENFLEMLGYGFSITDNITHANYDKEQLIADFRNYIKGE
jgi:hypothetical protein